MKFDSSSGPQAPKPLFDIFYRSVAQFGSARVLGTWGRRFKSCHSDHPAKGQSSGGGSPASSKDANSNIVKASWIYMRLVKLKAQTAIMFSRICINVPCLLKKKGENND